MNKFEYTKINNVIDDFRSHKLNTWGDKAALLVCNDLNVIKSTEDYEYGKTFIIKKINENMCIKMIHSDIDEVDYFVSHDINEICDYLKDNFEMDIECYEVQEGL